MTNDSQSQGTSDFPGLNPFSGFNEYDLRAALFEMAERGVAKLDSDDRAKLPKQSRSRFARHTSLAVAATVATVGFLAITAVYAETHGKSETKDAQTVVPGAPTLGLSPALSADFSPYYTNLAPTTIGGKFRVIPVSASRALQKFDVVTKDSRTLVGRILEYSRDSFNAGHLGPGAALSVRGRQAYIEREAARSGNSGALTLTWMYEEHAWAQVTSVSTLNSPAPHRTGGSTAGLDAASERDIASALRFEAKYSLTLPFSMHHLPAGWVVDTIQSPAGYGDARNVLAPSMFLVRNDYAQQSAKSPAYSFTMFAPDTPRNPDGSPEAIPASRAILVARHRAYVAPGALAIDLGPSGVLVGFAPSSKDDSTLKASLADVRLAKSFADVSTWIKASK